MGPDRHPSWAVEARFPEEVSSRVLLGLAGVGAGLVLHESWSTVKVPFDAVLALVIVIGATHGLLGWVPGLRIPGRPGATSYGTYAVVLLLELLLTADRLGAGPASVLWTRLASGTVLAVVVHRILDEAQRGRPVVPTWRGMAVLALLPGCLGALVLWIYGVPGAQPARTESVAALAVSAEATSTRWPAEVGGHSAAGANRAA